MPSKSKLTLALLGATALFTFNPGFVSRIVSGEQVRANEIAIELQSGDNLDALGLGTSDTDGAVNSANDALSPRNGQDATQNTAQDTALTNDARSDVVVAPGDNPFLAVAPAAVKVEPQAVVPVVVEKPAADNPFVDKAALAREKEQAVAPAARRVDDSALRYYASSKDLKRLGAEMRRLKALYPDWEPPKNLFSPVTDISEQPLWDIYKTGDYAKVRAQIALIQSTNPKWMPSEDLMAKLEIGETRALVNRAFAQGRWQQVILTAQTKPTIMVCEEMQVVWNVAESFARTRNFAQSFDLYKYVLSNCEAPDLRLATVQKASLLLPPKGTASLVALGRINADGSAEFEDIGFDGLRKQIGGYIQNGNFDQTPSDEELRRFVDFVQRTGSGSDAALIGWYFYAQEEWKTANSWFIAAAKFERSPKYIEGIILTLRNLDEQDDALKIARRFLKASPEIADQYIEIVSSELTDETSKTKLDDKELAEFVKAVNKRESALGAQALGWKYLSDGDKDEARSWFTQSVSWKPTEGGVVGLAVLAARAKEYRTLASLKTEYGKDYASLDDFKIYKPSKIYKRKKKIVAIKPAPRRDAKSRRITLFTRSS